MGYRDIINEIREMSPLKRRFTAAAIGFGTGAALVGTMGSGLAFLLAMGVGVFGGKILSDMSDGKPGLTKFKEPDYLKNIGSAMVGITLANFMLYNPPANNAVPTFGDLQGTQGKTAVTMTADVAESVTRPATSQSPVFKPL